jgi:farnesyl diphosphate synthase
MDYTLQNGGKRIRPLLIYATGTIFDAPSENLDIPAISVELIHTYSLIHDDLPCMDNADLRRGKPTCHKVHGEGMAVLAGDALHTLAMQIISSHPAPLSAERRLQMIQTLSIACGPYGMAAGQALDITALSQPNISLELIEHIYKLKTGVLLSACIELGHLASGDDNASHRATLKQFGNCIGLAFQIQDDILDIETTADISGKTQGIDLINNKITYPRICGIDKAKTKVANLYQEALVCLENFGENAQLLREITTKMLTRQH